MRYAKLMKNDVADGSGICVSLWVQGCPIRCSGCHNPQTWDFNGGKPVPKDILQQIDLAITANNIQRGFSVLGGEPLCDENIDFVFTVIDHVRRKFPNITIYLWTGNTLEEILKKAPIYKSTLDLINVLIDGPYIKEERDITLSLRGSRNQRILYKGRDF